MDVSNRRDRRDVHPNGFIAGEDILAGAILGTDPATGHLVMVGRIEPPAKTDETKLRRIREVLDDHDYAAGALYDIRQILDAEGGA